MNKIEDFRKRRQIGNDSILAEDYLPLKRFMALDTDAYREVEIPVKYKELMGLTGSVVLRCNDCIIYHIDKAIQEGINRKELVEALNIALIIGGSIVIPHVRFAFEVINQIENFS